MRELQFILTDSSGIAVTLQHAPDGWDESFIVTERSRKYHGIFRSFTIPMKFIKDGAAIIRNEFYTNGLTASCTLSVQKLDRATLTYFTAYTGKIEFSTFKDHDNDIEVTTIDGGLAQIIKTRESDDVMFTPYTMYSEPYWVPEGVDLYYPLTTTPALINQRCGAMRVYHALLAIMDKITGGKVADGTYGVKSDILSGVSGRRMMLTTESAIKWLEMNSTATYFRTNLGDFFQSLNAILCLGMGIEVIGGKETLVVEERSYFYNKTTILNVGNSKNLSLGYVADWIYSKIKAGYPNKAYNSDASAGNSSANINEPNTETIYEIPGATSKNEYDIVSKYRGDSTGMLQLYGAESLEPNGSHSDTGDYDPVIIRTENRNIDGTYRYIMPRGNLAKKDNPGVVVATPGNMYISPKRMVMAHQFFLNGCAFKLEGMVTLQSATNDQANNETSDSIYNTFYEKEYEGPTLRDYATTFRPIELIIEAAYPADFVDHISENPYGVVEFDYRGTTYKGYILKMETKLSGSGSIKYSLLSTNDNDLAKLIR